jgi:hypothetical protein
MADVFISFVHEEQEVAEAVQRLLTVSLDKKVVFLSSDKWQVHAGEVWLDKIKKELSSAKVIVLLLSARSVKKPWVNFEAGAAWLQGIPIVPACFGTLSKGTLPQPYSSVQALDLPSDAYYLATSVAKYVQFLPPPPFSGRHDKELEGLERAVAKVSSNQLAQKISDAE